MEKKEMPYLYQRLWSFISNYSNGQRRLKLNTLNGVVTSRFRLSKEDWNNIMLEFERYGKLKNRTQRECTIEERI